MPFQRSKLSSQARLTLLCLCTASVFGQWLAIGQIYPKLEASFSITNLATDPFDYTLTDVRVQILQPDASTISLPAFFDGGTTWRVRHTPILAGVYQVNGMTLNGQPVAVSNLQPSSWTVSRPMGSAGFVRVDPANTNRFITSNGRRYFPVGHNVAWDTSATTNVVAMLARLGAARENWSRVWMDDWDGKNLDWPKPPGPFGQLSLTVAQKWDGIVAAAEQAEVYFQMTLQHHGQYSSTVDAQWSSNPYNSANGGFLSNATQFFTNATAKAITKRKLRYVIARWGYSPAIMAWELFNEVQFTAAAQAGQWSIVGAWHDEMAQFIRSQDPYHHLITTSSDLNQPIWNQCDYYTHHDYPTDLISTLSDPAGVPSGQPAKPIFGAECGLDNTPHLGVNAPIWAGLMGAQSGNAQPWWWDRIDAHNDYYSFHALRDFTLYSGLAEQDGLSRSSPHVTSPQNSSLVFSPGGGWGNAVQDTFTVSDAAPPGIGTLPSYLQGNYHRGMTPNGYTFLVNYPPGGGTFSVQIVIVAASGAGLTIYLDGATANSISFPGTGADQNTNYVLSVNVPAGQHTVKLWNQGLDWVDIGNITLNPYVSILGAYQVGNTNFAGLWFWHRTNIYNPNASATVSGTFSLAGLAPGNYSGTWWDTFAGKAISNFTFTVSGPSPPAIPTPPILRSMAFFAAHSPEFGLVAAPEFPRILGTNSPPLNLQLQIGNAGAPGALPLLYSLSITGASPLSYSALNSAQPGGPVFAWKDYSAVGQDITTNFMALTAQTAKDEGIAGPIDIGFAFPFFSGGQSPHLFTQLYVSPNGFVSFSLFGGDTSVNQPLPGLAGPTNLIAFFWDDLDLSTTGHAYTYGDPLAGTFTLQFQNVRFKGTSSTVTCQLILKTTGEILMQYKSIAVSNSCTVGVQNAAGDQGLQVAFNQNYLQSNFSVLLTPNAWLALGANAGLVPNGKTDQVGLTLNPAGLGYGTNRATILIRTRDPLNPLVMLPVELDINPLGTWRQTYFGTPENSGSAADNADPDGDGWVNLLEYAFNTDPNAPNGSPLSYAVTGGHLTVTFKRAHPAPTDISYLFEVADELDSGLWSSGPAYTTQTVTDNLDGSETVVVTDLVAIPSRAAHYLRVRISQP
jgi:hypothetical protein